LIPLEIAVTPWRLGNAASLAEQGAFAEQLDFHSFWLPENHFGDERSIPSPLTLLAAVAARTTKIRLGSTSYLLPIRHPLQAAEEVAVLDHLSEGRVILGIGRGMDPRMFSAFGVNPKRKRSIFNEHLAIMKRAWAGKPIALDSGETVTLAPLPVQQPHPELWIAAFGPLALKQAGQLGLPYLASPGETVEKLKANYSVFKTACVESGQTVPTITPVMRTLFVSESPTVVDRVRTGLAASPSREPAAVEDWAIIGSKRQVADQIMQLRAALGVTHLVARGRLPAVDTPDLMRSLESLADIRDTLLD